MTENPVKSLLQCYSIADNEMDNGNEQAAHAINYAAGTADMYRRHMRDLAWACKEKNARKRNDILQRVLMELDTNGESLIHLPLREYRK